MATDGKMHTVFVYGTLKRGEPNYHLMLETDHRTATFMGKGETTSKYPLVVATQYNNPFLLKSPGQGYEIPGDVYTVDDTMLKFLDDFERHPDLYKREPASVILKEDEKGQPCNPSKELQCGVYFLSEVKQDFLQLKWLKTYTSISDEYPAYVYTKPIPIIDLVFPGRKKQAK